MSYLLSIGKVLTPTNIVAGVKLAEMGFRPAITMSNKEIPEDTRKYAATGEFFTEFFGFIATLTCGNLIEFAGGQLFAKKLTPEKQFLTQQQFKELGEKSLHSLREHDKKIKIGILLSSFIGATFAGAIVTPLLNNVVLNKFMDKIIKKKDQKNKAPEAVSVNSTKIK